ncbi:SprT family protein [Ectobacillus antri]|uniref:Protein SprT-like n=1 Tax=Ectobacillus antri TaxID=2486280 RepID=A0ABT6H6M9_9BACI|nr:SprT family protein [Ectobacillus antri]MDG4657906.1 SprT family protein [Ectobacillus antri]MDG5755010.1 SprT family protein [Ectobacillus antri]
MDELQLQKVTEDISLRYFQKPFQHRAVFNNRLKTTGGRYLLQTHNIELNPHYYEAFGKEELIAVIKHELCHYHLHLEGKGYKHRDADFRNLMQKVGAPRFCKVIPGKTGRRSQKLYTYECSSCHLRYQRKRKVDIMRYVCGKCKGRLISV